MCSGDGSDLLALITKYSISQTEQTGVESGESRSIIKTRHPAGEINNPLIIIRVKLYLDHFYIEI